jgi:hypothetical protein
MQRAGFKIAMASQRLGGGKTRLGPGCFLPIAPLPDGDLRALNVSIAALCVTGSGNPFLVEKRTLCAHTLLLSEKPKFSLWFHYAWDASRYGPEGMMVFHYRMETTLGARCLSAWRKIRGIRLSV